MIEYTRDEAHALIGMRDTTRRALADGPAGTRGTVVSADPYDPAGELWSVRGRTVSLDGRLA